MVRKSVFFPAKSRKLARVVRIDNPLAASNSAVELHGKFLKSKSRVFKRDFKAEAKLGGIRITPRSIASFKRSVGVRKR